MRYREIDWSDVTVGQEIHLEYKEPRGSGVSGVVEWLDPWGLAVKLVSGTARVERTIRTDEIRKVTVEEYLDADECLDWRDDGSCRGPVDYRWTGGDRSWPRCEGHWETRMERRENSMEIYADSDVVPDWFDPSYAGERWDDD